MKKVDVPIYNFVTHRRESKTVSMYGANVIIFEGILAFHEEAIRSMLDMKVFVDTDSDVRLARRLKRDITDRGRDIHGVLQQYENHVKPAYDRFIATTMTFADIIVPRGGENQVKYLLPIVDYFHGDCAGRHQPDSPTRPDPAGQQGLQAPL